MKTSSGFYVVNLMPETRKTRVKRTPPRVFATDDGCEWLPTCKECRFGQCEARIETTTYGSPAGQAIRTRRIIKALDGGAAPEELEEFFMLRHGEVQQLMNKVMCASSVSRKANVKRLARAARRRGEPEAVVALRCGVSTRTVRTWCAEDDSIPRHQGNLARRERATARREERATV